MHIAIVGAGALGGYLGALLTRAGHEVTIVARGDTLEVLRNSGLSLRSSLHGDFVVHPGATDRFEGVGPVDLVLVCVKTYDLDGVAGQLSPLVGTHTVVMPIQNGVDAAERVGREIGAEHVVPAATYVNAAREAPGVIRHVGGERLIFGEAAGGTSERCARLLDAFTDAGIAAEADPDIRLALWQKFAVVCATGGVMAFTRLSIGPVLADLSHRALMYDAVSEVAAVGRAEGVTLSEDYPEQVMTLLGGYPPSAKSSMLADLEAGRRLESEAITGTAVRLGRVHGVPTPKNEAIYRALGPFAAGDTADPAESPA